MSAPKEPADADDDGFEDVSSDLDNTLFVFSRKKGRRGTMRLKVGIHWTDENGVLWSAWPTITAEKDEAE